jgi:hypothetical protein
VEIRRVIEYSYSDKRKPWEYYERMQEETLKASMSPRLWAFLEELEKILPVKED